MTNGGTYFKVETLPEIKLQSIVNIVKTTKYFLARGLVTRGDSFARRTDELVNVLMFSHVKPACERKVVLSAQLFDVSSRD